MKVTLGFRLAEKSDIKFLLNLRKSSMTEHLENAGIIMSDEEHLLRIKELFNDSHIIQRNGQAIGLLKLGVLADRLHIRQLQILPAYHGLGIGGKVLKVVKKYSIKLKRPITLNVLLDNPALTLYQRCGFEIENKNKLEYQMRCPIPHYL
jgi:ribosomal protein S18 acetylase RimI-like enzyme